MSVWFSFSENTFVVWILQLIKVISRRKFESNNNRSTQRAGITDWRLFLMSCFLRPQSASPRSARTHRPSLSVSLCWKQRPAGKLSQQSDGLRAASRMLQNHKRPSRLRLAKTNDLELLAVFRALKHFLPFLHDCHIVISSDSSTTKPYISRQREAGGFTAAVWAPLHDPAADRAAGTASWWKRTRQEGDRSFL